MAWSTASWLVRVPSSAAAAAPETPPRANRAPVRMLRTGFPAPTLTAATRCDIRFAPEDHLLWSYPKVIDACSYRPPRNETPFTVPRRGFRVEMRAKFRIPAHISLRSTVVGGEGRNTQPPLSPLPTLSPPFIRLSLLLSPSEQGLGTSPRPFRLAPTQAPRAQDPKRQPALRGGPAGHITLRVQIRSRAAAECGAPTRFARWLRQRRSPSW